MSCIDVETVLEAFITTSVARFSVPARITTDRGTQFTAGTWGDWCRKQGVQHITTTAYQRGCSRLEGPSTRGILPWVLLGMQNAPREETGVSAAEAALQQQLVVPADMEELPVPPAVIPPTVHSYA